MNSNREFDKLFDWDRIKYGVAKGYRHAALDAYLYQFVSRRIDSNTMMDIILFWNRGNMPPLHVEEVIRIACDYLEKYKKYKKSRQNLTFPAPAPRSFVTAEAHGVPIGYWFTEIHGIACRMRKIVRRGMLFESMPLQCRQWYCLECGPRMAKEWVEHLIKVTRGQDLYLIEAFIGDYFQIVKAINEAKADYLWVKENSITSKIVVNKPIEQATRIPRSKTWEILTDVMPLGAYYPSIDTTSHWKCPRSRMDLTAKLLLETPMPLYRIKKIAVDLGAELCGDAEWQSPVSTDVNEWEIKLVETIQNCNEEINKEFSRLSDINERRATKELYILDANFGLWEKYWEEGRNARKKS